MVVSGSWGSRTAVLGGIEPLWLLLVDQPLSLGALLQEPPTVLIK